MLPCPLLLLAPLAPVCCLCCAVSVTTEAPSVTNKTRSYPSLTAAAAEAVTSRVYAGAHFRRSTQDSYDFGLKVRVACCQHAMPCTTACMPCATV